MLRINSDTKIYILSPYIKTGGPRTLHQLAKYLKKLGLKVYIIYYIHYRESKKPIIYSDCNVDVIDEIEDNFKNILIVPEAHTGQLRKYKKIQKVIWWLSLDYYLIDSLIKKSTLYTIKRKNLPLFFVPVVFGLKFLIRLFFKPNALNMEEFGDIYHLYNCEYVRHFLLNHGIKETDMEYLCGPIEDSYFQVDKMTLLANKSKLVAFNPAKIDPILLNTLKKELLKKDSTIEMIELKNMTKDEVFNVLSRTKVYVDLGFFPGPERIPREAVSLYCNIITSTEGSAANKIDVMIPEKYKFDINKLKIESLIDLIIDMINNFEIYTKDFDDYRLKAKNQKQIFDDNIRKIFLKDSDM